MRNLERILSSEKTGTVFLYAATFLGTIWVVVKVCS